MSSTMGGFAAALSAAQAELKDPRREKSGQVKGKKDYRYAGLDDVLQSVRPVLARHGIAFTQTFALVDGREVLRTTLLHRDGGSVSGDYPLTWPADPQQQGSAATYARRYSLEAIIGIAATDDDDASSASEGKADTETADKPAADKPPEVTPDSGVLDQLVKEGWEPRERVVLEVRDFFRWLGIDGDPWAMALDRQRKFPTFCKEKQTELDAWIAWRGDLAGLLTEAKLTADHLCAWLEANDRPPVNEMNREQREKLIGFLRDAGGIGRVRDLITKREAA